MDFNLLVPTIQADVEKKQSYLEHRSFLARNFFSEKLVEFIQISLQNTNFDIHDYLAGPDSRVHEYIAKSRFIKFVRELMNDQSVLHTLEEITGHKGLHNFNGRIYKLDSSVAGMDWHQDMDGNKKISVTINISTEIFTGGELIIHNKVTGEIQKFHNVGYGDAIFFEVNKDYQHRVLPVTGDVPKLAVAGWYHL